MVSNLIYFLFTTLLFGEPSLALTVQKPELLLYKSDTIYIHVEYRNDSPLSDLFLLNKYNEKLERQIDTTCWSSGCAREYAPIWKILNNELYLNKLKHCCSGQEVSLSNIFEREKISKDGVKTFWVDKKFIATDKFVEFYYFTLEEYSVLEWREVEIEVKEGIVKHLKMEIKDYK